MATAPRVAPGGRCATLTLTLTLALTRWQLRDVRVGEERRTKPLHRWVGPVPCACVREAVAVFSLQNTPSPAEWPEHIGHLELAMQATRLARPRAPHRLAPSPPRPLAASPSPSRPLVRSPCSPPPSLFAIQPVATRTPSALAKCTWP